MSAPIGPLPVIDMHAHFVPHEFPNLVERFGTAGWPWMRHDGPDDATIMIGDREFRRVDSRCWDARRRLEDMDRDGVDMQLVSPTPVFFSYDRDPAEAAVAAVIFNDVLAAMNGAGDGRLCCLAQVPLQDTDAACAELERCMSAGFRGVEIGTHIGADGLDSDGIVTFLQHCASLDAAVFVHPWDVLGADRLTRFMTAWTVGMPAETHLSIVSLVLGGAFDRLPRTLRIAFAHGGGNFAMALGRLENAWRRQPAAKGVAANAPSTYTDRFSVDANVFDPPALRLLVDVMGPERVMLGSDYPFPLGEEEIGGLIRSAGFDDVVRDRLLGGNAATFIARTAPHVKAVDGPQT